MGPAFLQATLAALCVHATEAVVGCRVADDCSLNGVCESGTCACDIPWVGPTCGRFAVHPVDRSKSPGAAAYGYDPNVSSWGGSILPDPAGSGYHLFVAQMRSGGLTGWQTESECVHATSATLSGPYTRQSLVLSNECHGPVALYDLRSKAWLLFHIGDGGLSSNTSSFLHYSYESPAGPWSPAPSSPGQCNMPTAAFDPGNGTLYVLCGNGSPVLFSTPHWNDANAVWTEISRIATPNRWEDPTLWFDSSGNWHVLFHVFSLAPFAAHDERYSGHAWSRDGHAWSIGQIEPLGGTIQFTDGTVETFATRERHQLVFLDMNRSVPAGVTSAVSSQPLGPWCDSCYEGACSQCKITPGRDWTYTIFQSFHTVENLTRK